MTARRAAENLQDVPVAVSAMSSADLAREAINTGQDLQGRVPSLTISANSQQRSTEAPTIRGQGGTFGAGPGVVIYFAEVPLPADSVFNGQGGPGKFFDLANMQVLKGSQGTLFGRNTTGGALLLEPQKPKDKFEASLKGEGSNYGGLGYEGVLNTPIIDNTLLMRAAVKYFDREGFTKDADTGKDYDNKHFWNARLGITWRPTDNIENYLLGHYAYNHDNGTGVVIEGFNPSGLNYGLLAQGTGTAPSQTLADLLNVGCLYFNLQSGSSNCGQDIVDEQQARGIRRVRTSTDPMDKLSTGGLTDQFKLDLNEQLTFRNIASYSFFKHVLRWDMDGSSAAMDDIVNPTNKNLSDTSQITEEAQLQGTGLDSKLKYVVGIYYQKVKPEGDQSEYPVAIFNTLPAQEFSIEQSTWAPYAQGTYDLGGLVDSLSGLSLTLGARYTKDRSSGTSNAGGTEHGDSYSKGVMTYTAGLDYKIDTVLLYGKISRGYKAGGFSPIAVNAADYTYKPEYVTNYEIGEKADFEVIGMPARVNAALYYTDYTDMQRAGTDKEGANYGGAIFTAGKASIMGFEMDATLQLFQGFTLLANYAYTQGKYDKFQLQNNAINPQLDCTGALVPQGGVAKLDCVPFQYTPKHQASGTARYELPVDPDLGFMDASVTYSWIDRQYSSSYTLPQAEPGAWLGSFGLLNASFQWNNILNSPVDLQLYGTNLTDRTYRISNSNVWNVIYFRSSIYGEPRIYGAQLTYHFGA
ncbi:Outer membrane receptor proteins, mostly Fe transport [Solimonas aquatica]|uniref:Outer membrane receptor proteins, mostly Fe transport n=1 Tax=Solimonas aquatica TaxID=489703 RepID=A0A1H9LB74_9GAMM|nr:TonB-dependent receptor plug domain-containing protein [Solimonas aquatica]SER08644.1 Outer membrane receptor proteins, mostly Fe transport [Solimonas aquatica]